MAKATAETAAATTTGARSRKPAAASKEAAAAAKDAAAPAKDAAAKTTKTAGAAKTAAKTPAGKRPAAAKESAAKEPAAAKESKAAGGGNGSKARSEFLGRQRATLLAERANYTSQAEELKAQADSLALEHEPGDVQFDEEGGEGGTSNVDRELDLLLSAQARAAITEIDLALAKIDNGTYGVCEQCGAQIPEARLEALPHASLCVACKNGGLSSRR